MAKATRRIVISYDAINHKDEEKGGTQPDEIAGQLATGLGANGIATELDGVTENSATKDPSEFDLVVVLWTKGAALQLRRRAQRALEAGRLFVIAADLMHDLPLPLQYYKIPKDFVDGDRLLNADELAETVRKIEQSVPSWEGQRQHPVIHFIRTALSPVVDPTSFFYKRRNWIRIHAAAWPTLDTFDSLEVLDRSSRKELSGSLENAARDWAAYDLWLRSLNTCVAAAAVVMLVVVCVLVPVLVLRLTHITLAGLSSVAIAAAYMIGLVTTAVVITVPMGLAQYLVSDFDFRFSSRSLALVWVFMVIGIVGLTSAQVLMPPQLTWVHAIVIGAAATALAVINVLLWTLSASYLRRRLGRRGSYILPEARLVTGLLLLLREAIRFRASPPDADERNLFMSGLEELADAAERGLSRRTRAGDSATDLWLISTAQRMAAALRAMKKLVALPVAPARNEQPPTPWAEKRRGSWDQIVDSLRDSFACATRGDWAAMPQAEPTRITRPQRLTLLVRFVQSLFAALVPALALWVVLSYRRFDQAIEAWAILGVVLWAVVSLLMAVDPNAASKITFIKDLRSPLDVSKSDTK